MAEAGYPMLPHSAVVLRHVSDNPQAYAACFYRLDAYRNTYAHAIAPPNADATDLVPSFRSPS